YSPLREGGTSEGGEAYELEDLAGIHYGDCWSGAAVIQRISGHGKPDSASPAERARAAERRRAQSLSRDWPEAGEASPAGRGDDRQARYHSRLASQARGSEV